MPRFDLCGPRWRASDSRPAPQMSCCHCQLSLGGVCSGGGSGTVAAVDRVRSALCSGCGSPWIHDQFGNQGCSFFITASPLASSSSVSDDDCPDVPRAAGVAGAAFGGPEPPRTVLVARPTGAAWAAGVWRLFLHDLPRPSTVSGASEAINSFII